MNSFKKTNSENKEIKIIGDINCNYFDRSNGKLILTKWFLADR